MCRNQPCAASGAVRLLTRRKAAFLLSPASCSSRASFGAPVGLGGGGALLGFLCFCWSHRLDAVNFQYLCTMQLLAFGFLKACKLVQAGFTAPQTTSCCILVQMSANLMQHTYVRCKSGGQQNTPVMEVPGASFGRLLGILHSAAPTLACHNFIGLLYFDKALRCLGAFQIWVVPAEGALDQICTDM